MYCYSYSPNHDVNCYLLNFSSLLQAVIDNGSDKDKLILAKFLDDEYYNLRVLGDHKNEEL